jgi:hypothetical protein
MQEPVSHEENSCCFLSTSSRDRQEEEQNVDYVFEQIFKKSTTHEGNTTKIYNFYH